MYTIAKLTKYIYLFNKINFNTILKHKIYTYKKLRYKAIYNVCYYNIIVIYINFFNNF